MTDVVDAGEDDAQGYVILFHGLAANKKIMSFVARGFALEGLRVFVPDLPGHEDSPYANLWRAERASGRYPGAPLPTERAGAVESFESVV